MTATTLTHLPLQVGSVVLTSTGRMALWLIARYMRNPLTNTAIAALVVTSAIAGSNALYGQRHAHPAPLFSASGDSIAKVEPVVPMPRPKSLRVTAGAPAPEAEAPALLSQPAEQPAPAAEGPIGNKDVYDVQRKLEQLGLFVGTVDGYYGPQTARAIRKFEELQGTKPVGQLSREVIDAILAAPLSGKTPPSAPAAELAPVVDTPAPRSADAVAPQTLAALPEPRPLGTELETPAASSKPATLLGRPVPESADAAVEMAADTAGDAIDTILAGVDGAVNGKSLNFADDSAASSAPTAKPGVPLIIDEAPTAPGTPIKVLDTAATPDELKPAFSVSDPTTVAKVQRGLASLGFLHGPADGVAGEATAKAIRNFEVYFNYKVTGRISPELMGMLSDSGASI